MDWSSLLTLGTLIPVVGGSVYAILCTVAVLWFFRRRRQRGNRAHPFLPPVTILKPVHGLETNLKARLRTACLQDYPDYQVVFCIQDPADPALPLVREIQREFGPERVTVAVHAVEVGPNGKVNNLVGGLAHARHDVLVISDSDVILDAHYLEAIVAPLADASVGGVCTPFKVAGARRWFERLELLSVNAEFMPSVIFAEVTRASEFCLGPSVALRRSTLVAIGGLEALAEYLAEDYEIGRRIWASGARMVLVPHVVGVELDFRDWRHWWTHQVYWDQNTRVARPVGFFATVLTRSVPFALILAVATGFAPPPAAVFAGAVAVRLVAAAITLGAGFRDREGVRSLPLLPLRDVIGLLTWALAFVQKTVVWRGVTFRLTRGGRMIAISKAAWAGGDNGSRGR